MLSDGAKEEIRQLTLRFLEEVKEISPSIKDIKKQYPFHVIFFSEEGTLAARAERSLVTKMGQQLYPALAEIVARESYKEVEREKPIVVELQQYRLDVINRICTQLREGGKQGERREPDHRKEIEEVRVASGGEKTTAQFVADLFCNDPERGTLFYEIKSPMPNLDVCTETKRKLLLFHCLHGDVVDGGGEGWFAFPYNPFRTHIPIATGGKTAMDMHVGLEFL